MAAIAQMPSEMMLRLMDGSEQCLSQYRGRVVVVQVMSTHCGRCVEIIRLLNTLQETFGPEQFQPLAIAINAEAKQTIEEFVQQSSPAFPVALDNKQNICTLAGLPADKPLYLPVIVFIGRDGVIRALSAPGTDFYTQAETTFPAMVQKLLEEQA